MRTNMCEEPHLSYFTWELTTRCNMHCRHCGSDCTADPQGVELSRDQALWTANELKRFKIDRIVFTGGEPLLCSYWNDLAAVLGGHAELGMVTNGSLIDLRTAALLKQYGFKVVSVSIDGVEQYHDMLRGSGSYRKCMEAVYNIKQAGLTPAVNTTVTRGNLAGLPFMLEELASAGVQSWQIQPALPSGRMSKHRNELILRDDIKYLARFAAYVNMKGGYPVIFPAETIGYYSFPETVARRIAYNSDKLPVWRGCPAGISSMGILATGELVGCVSLRDKRFRDKNVKDLMREGFGIADYWNRGDSFKWRRLAGAEMLGGKCRECRYRSLCLGGCTNARYCFNGFHAGDQPFCTYWS